LKCFQKDIAKRASAKELLEHNWFKQVRESTAAEVFLIHFFKKKTKKLIINFLSFRSFF